MRRKRRITIKYYKLTRPEQIAICCLIGEWYLLWKNKVTRKNASHNFGLKKEYLKDLFCEGWPPPKWEEEWFFTKEEIRCANSLEGYISLVMKYWSLRFGSISSDQLLSHIAFETGKLYLQTKISREDLFWLTDQIDMNHPIDMVKCKSND